MEYDPSIWVCSALHESDPVPPLRLATSDDGASHAGRPSAAPCAETTPGPALARTRVVLRHPLKRDQGLIKDRGRRPGAAFIVLSNKSFAYSHCGGEAVEQSSTALARGGFKSIKHFGLLDPQPWRFARLSPQRQRHQSLEGSSRS